MKEELTVYNLPENVLFQFSKEGNYVWKVKRCETIDGNYAREVADVFTEVYRQDGDGVVRCQWSGTLVNNPNMFGKDGVMGANVFSIFSGDMDTSANFEIDMPLTEADPAIAKQLTVPELTKTR